MSFPNSHHSITVTMNSSTSALPKTITDHTHWRNDDEQISIHIDYTTATIYRGEHRHHLLHTHYDHANVFTLDIFNEARTTARGVLRKQETAKFFDCDVIDMELKTIETDTEGGKQQRAVMHVTFKQVPEGMPDGTPMTMKELDFRMMA